jgi:hypothetical protein
MLHEIGYDHMKFAVDVEYSEATKSGKLPSLVVTPPIMAQWKTGTTGDSDIRNDTFGPGSGPAVRQSVRALLKENVYAKTPTPFRDGDV